MVEKQLPFQVYEELSLKLWRRRWWLHKHQLQPMSAFDQVLLYLHLYPLPSWPSNTIFSERFKVFETWVYEEEEEEDDGFIWSLVRAMFGLNFKGFLVDRHWSVHTQKKKKNSGRWLGRMVVLGRSYLSAHLLSASWGFVHLNYLV